MDHAAQAPASEVEQLRGEIDQFRSRLGKEIADLRVDILKFAIWMAVGVQTTIVLGAMVTIVKLVKP